MIRTAIAILLTSAAPLFAQEALPARLQIILRDSQRQPIADAKVTLTAEAPPPIFPLTATSDQNGRVLFTPPVDRPLSTLITIEKPGLGTFKSGAMLFKDAQLESQLILVPPRRTIVHVRGPDGQSIEGLPLKFSRQLTFFGFRSSEDFLPPPPTSDGQIVYGEPLGPPYAAPREVVTDASGDGLWIHPPAPEGFFVAAGPNAPMPPAHPLAVAKFPDADDVTLTLTPEAAAKAFPTRILHGKLLLPDGTPAKDWFIAGRVSRTTGMGSTSPYRSMDYYASEKFSHPAADGSFEIRAPGPYFGIIAPEGMQFLYTLNPESWTGGNHQLTLTVPAISRTLRTQLVDLAGQPMGGIPVRPTWMQSGSYWWQLLPSDRFIAGVAGNAPWKMEADAQGWIDYPLYAGASPMNFQVGDPWIPNVSDNGYSTTGQFGLSTRIALTRKSGSAAPQSVVRHVTLALVDPDGKLIANVPNFELKADYQTFGRSSYVDSTGQHFFLNAPFRTLDLSIPQGAYKPLRRTLTLQDTPRQTITVRLERNPPVRGIIRDANAQPAAGIPLVVYTNDAPANAGTDGKRYLDLRTTTDAQGQFEFAGAPEDCFIYVASPRPPEPLKVTLSARNHEVSLPPHGSLRVRLPQTLTLPPSLRYVQVVSIANGSKDISAHVDTLTRDLTANGIPPGRYHLSPIPALGDISANVAEVTAGTETTLDLRSHPLAPWAAAPLQSLTFIVEKDGKAHPGAEVAIFADVPAEQFSENESRGDGLVMLAADLSDNTGTVRAQTRAGQKCIAIARIRGGLLAIQPFDVPANANPAAIKLVLQPTRSILVTAPAQGTPVRQWSFQIQKPEGTARAALLRALSDDHLWGASMFGGASSSNLTLQPDAAGFTFDGLPTGTVISIQPPQAPGTNVAPPPLNPITIIPGEGPMEPLRQ